MGGLTRKTKLQGLNGTAETIVIRYYHTGKYQT